MNIQTINPATEEVIGNYEAAKESEIKYAVEKSRTAFAGWRANGISERTALLTRLSKILSKNREKYAGLITKEMGKPIKESLSEVEKCSLLCDYYAENAEKFLEDETVETEARRSYVAFEPLGVVACIMPWNFPFWQVMRFAVPAMTAGNTIVLKHSSICPGSALEICDAMEESGFPKDVFQTVIGSAPVGEALIKSDVNAVSVTGSLGTGKIVAKLAVDGMKKFVLELGGDDPLIILEDADIEEACRGAVRGRIVNSGQSCIAAKRFIVVEGVAQEFTDMLVEETAGLKIGDPTSMKTDVGPLVREAARRKLGEQIDDSVKAGAEILLGGRNTIGKGYFYQPTVMGKVTGKMRVASEETFGPVAPIMVARDEEDAIRIANDSELGLGASVWTRDLERGERVARRLEAGVVCVNGTVHSDPRMPFGGVKKSGVGRELSHYGLKEFVNVKSVKIM
ncbi:MAG: NAD-dependent succinate-semialdehyde dehydrogenase [Candidatus Aenigmarchaeota archaeon]|nr:NAD-dependent succinate-semialdehyde dehydrogenase [Candidatus Aenigmarchaeota archaeon]